MTPRRLAGESVFDLPVEFPGTGTVRYRGANLTVKPTATGEGWRKLWGVDWDETWMTDQIDLAVSAGANAIRVIGGVNAIVEGDISRATYHARQEVILDYCVTEGLDYYCVAAGDYSMTMLDSATTTEIVALAEFVADYSNVLAFEPFQEWDLWIATNGNESAFWAKMIEWRQGIIDAGVSLPIAYSGSGAATEDKILAAANLSDFVDVHLYANPASDFLTDLNGMTGKEIVVGEYGASQSMSTGARAARYTAVKNACNDTPTVKGAFQWAVVDQSASSSDKWGLFDGTGTIRADMGDVYVTFAKTRTWPPS